MNLLSTPGGVRRAGGLVALVGALSIAAIAPASAPARMYVSTSSMVDAAGVQTGYIEGYAYADGQPNGDTFKLDVVRGGAIVATQTAQAYVGIYPFVPQVADQIVLTDVTTSESHATSYTGRPVLGAEVCGSPIAFSGIRDAGATANVSANVYFGAYDARNDYLSPVTFYGPGTGFSGNFAKRLAPEWDVTASQSRVLSSSFTVFSDSTRPVGQCPAPAIVAPPPAAALPIAATPPARDVVPPKGAVVTPAARFRPTTAYRALMGGKFAVTVVVDEPGVVTHTLYLDDGARLPTATAAAKSRVARKPTVLGTGRTAIARAGKVKVNVKLSKKGRSRLRRSRAVKLALVTAITDTAGNSRVLKPKRFTVRRVKGTK
ncbi:MAG TPA: hypothetical protein VNT03_03585 [Baekduia sp.]|nr:hypothetical protein [Baekduia sp.]